MEYNWLLGVVATSAFSMLFGEPLVYPQHRLSYHCSQTIGTTLQTADRASCQILNAESTQRSSWPTCWWLLKLLLHIRVEKYYFGTNSVSRRQGVPSCCNSQYRIPIFVVFPPKVVVEWLKLLLCIREVRVQISTPVTGNPDWVFSWFSSVPPSECRIIP
jgi:hypothetical protein